MNTAADHDQHQSIQGLMADKEVNVQNQRLVIEALADILVANDHRFDDSIHPLRPNAHGRLSGIPVGVQVVVYGHFTRLCRVQSRCLCNETFLAEFDGLPVALQVRCAPHLMGHHAVLKWSITDRVNRGVITPEMANAELEGLAHLGSVASRHRISRGMMTEYLLASGYSGACGLAS